MRAVKSVLLASASLRRLYADLPEPEIVLRAIVDVNLPKFLEQDISLFIGIYMDLFPGVELPMVSPFRVLSLSQFIINFWCNEAQATQLRTESKLKR